MTEIFCFIIFYARIRDNMISIGFVIFRLAPTALLFIINPIIAIIINIITDCLDGPIFRDYFKMKSDKYQIYDKSLDFVYYFALMIMVFWLGLPMMSLLFIFFTYRIIGQIIFFFTRKEEIFLYFLNFFEYFVISVLLINILGQSWTIPIFSAAIIFKIWHEIFIHKQKKSFTKIFWIPFLKKAGILTK